MSDVIWSDRPVPASLIARSPMFRIESPPSGEVSGIAGSRSDVVAVIAAYAVRYDEDMFRRLPNLRVLVRTGIGVDNVDIPAATRRGIVVCNTPDAPSIATAEHAVALMLAVAKRVLPTSRWTFGDDRPPDPFQSYDGIELAGRRLGLIGVGRIGGRVARIGAALGMDVVGVTRSSAPDGNWTAVDLETAVTTADVLSLHVPLTAETSRLLTASEFARMRPDAILINTARGGIVDETALIDSISTGRLAGAGLDVFDPEPPRPDNPLLHHPRVVATPHLGGATIESKSRIWTSAFDRVAEALSGADIANVVNADVIVSRRQAPLETGDPRSTHRGKAARDGRGEALGGVDYFGHTKAELLARARELDVEGRSKMDKLELARAIARKQR